MLQSFGSTIRQGSRTESFILKKGGRPFFIQRRWEYKEGAQFLLLCNPLLKTTCLLDGRYVKSYPPLTLVVKGG